MSEFYEILEAVKPDISWKVCLRDTEKTIYRQIDKTYFEEISTEACKMELRDLEQLEFATPSTIGSLVTALTEDSKRLIDEALFIEQRRSCIGFLNGVFDLHTGKVRKYQTSDYVLQPLPHKIPTNLDEKAEKRLLKVLQQWVGVDVGEWLLSVLAYMLFIYPNHENIWLNLFGAGSNGKSVCLELLETILGDDKVVGCNLKDINRFSGDTFQKKWLIIGRDSSESVSDNATSFIKNYTGDRKFTVERKGGASYDVVNSGKLIVSTNGLIRSKDRSYAWYRRLFPVPFPFEFPRDEKFKEKLFEQVPDLIRVLLHHAYLYKHSENTLFKSIPRPVLDLMKETRMLNDRVTAFWEEYFFKTPDQDSHDPRPVLDWTKLFFLHKKTMSEVYALFADWHEKEFADTELEPSLKNFGGPYGAFMQTGAGKYFTYKRSKLGRVLELLPQYNEGAKNDE